MPVPIIRSEGGSEQAASFFDNPCLFEGQRYDSESGTYYFRNRFYSPVLGRFLQRDPVGYKDGMSLYYAYFAPFGYDPMGLGKVVLEIKVYFTEIKLTEEVKKEVDRILQNAMAKAIPKDSEKQPKHQVSIKWTPVEKDVKQGDPSLGKKKDKVVVSVNHLFKGAGMGQGGHFSGSLNKYWIRDEFARVKDEGEPVSYDEIVGLVIAHELFHECLGRHYGLWGGHYPEPGFLDSDEPPLKSVLSNEGAKALAKSLGVNE